MKIFDKNTNQEITTYSSRMSGTDRVIECLTKSKNSIITNITFGSKSRGCINGIGFHNKITFKDCLFNYVDFNNLNGYSFINCSFYKCCFYDTTNISMVDCRGDVSTAFYSNYGSYTLSGKCLFANCHGIQFYEKLNPDVDITINNTPGLQNLLNRLKEQKRKEEEARLESLRLRKSVKYGYKVVNAKVLVKLSFPDEVDIVNLDKDKSRASGAMVESVHIINNFKGEGVSNKAYCPTEYKVGQMVYPDSFDSNPSQDCGHGIHFCKNINDLKTYGGLTQEEVDNIIKQNL